MKKKKMMITVLIVLTICVILAMGISAIVCRNALTVRDYTLPVEGVEQPFTAVCISDLHSREYGEHNLSLLEKIRGQQPDVIFTLGDLISRDASDAEVDRMFALLEELRRIAPVFASFGNHEEDYMRNTGSDLRPRYREAGVTLLDEQYCIVPVGDGRICLGGTLGHLYPFGRSQEEYLQSPEYRLMTAMQDTGLPTIVLSHRPDTIIFVKAYENWDIDLFLSGHTHGGVIRLPLIGGLYAPMQGFFPKYDKGFFQLEKVRLIISSGLAGYGWIPRIFNKPEITVLRITAEES